MTLDNQQYDTNEMVPHFDALKQRVDRFLSLPSSDKKDSAKNFINEMEEFGEIAIFGGLLRDLSLETNRTFYSDIDIVIQTDDERGLALKMAKYGAKKNSYDGYRLQHHKWKIDLWPLKKTWAFREGLVKEESFSSLLKTTFFDWDAVVFNYSKSKIYSIDDYLKKLSNRVVDINLKENPNSMGMIVRALRLLEKRNAKFSYNLSEYVFWGITQNGINAILEDELNSYSNNLLTKTFLVDIYRQLKTHLETGNSVPFSHRYKYQLSLFD